MVNVIGIYRENPVECQYWKSSPKSDLIRQQQQMEPANEQQRANFARPLLERFA